MAKVTFIGAGSTVFARNLLGDILGHEELAGSEITLFDIDAQRLSTSELVARRVADTLDTPAKITATTDRRAALDGADYAINMIQVGGYEPCTVIDFEVPKRFGLRQTIADTLGIGGIMRGLRTIPVLLDICHDMEQVCPDVWFLNYTNPMAINCRAITRSSPIRTVGLCHSVQGTAFQLARDLGIPYSEIDYIAAGINHMAFYVRFEHDGEDLYPRLHELAREGKVPDDDRVRYEVLKHLGYFVTESSEHFAEYVPWFVKRDRPDLVERFNIPLDEYPRRCIEQIANWESERSRLEEGGPIDVRPSFEYAATIIRSVETGKPRVIYGNVPNGDLIDNLPTGCTVEVPCLVDGNGVQPTRIGALPPQLAALIRTNVNVHELTVEAALTGKREHVYHAAMLDPHTAAELDLDQIHELVDALLDAHAEWVPESERDREGGMIRAVTGDTWTGDACALVEAFRRGERSPREELEATLAAIANSDLNCFSYLDPEGALDAARRADISLPFGGLPVGVKELEPVAGWPQTEGSLVFRDRIATETSTIVERLLGAGGAVPVGLTTASEFGGLNVSVTKLNGVTHNPWRHGRTTGGSSAGSAAAVAGGLVPLATGGDGGGSIRIPAGYSGLLGMKGTYGRIPRGPHAYFTPGTIVLGCLARSVRDAARFFDVCGGYDSRDPSSLPSRGDWEARLGEQELRGRRVAIVPNLGGVTLEPGVEEQLYESARTLVKGSGMVEVDLTVEIPNLAAQWMMGNLATLLAELGPRWPACASDLTDEVAIGLLLSQSMYNLRTASVAEELRIRAYAEMARAFDRVDFVIAPTNPGPAFGAEAAMSNPTTSFIDSVKGSRAALAGFRLAMGGVRLSAALFPRLPSLLLEQLADRFPDLVRMGALTMISNLYGNPAVSIPAGLVDGLPVGMQVLARHHADELLFDVALAVERETPWPLVAPSPAPGPAEAGDVEHFSGEVGVDLTG